MDHKKMRIQGSVSVIQNQISLPVNKKNRIISKQMYKEALPCVRMEGSYMTELAVGIPFFVGFLLLLLFFFRVLAVEQEVGNALLVSGRKLAVISCQEGENPMETSLTAKAMLLKNLPKDSFAAAFIRGGRSGISLKNSDFSGNYIRLKADYRIRFPLGLFGKKELHITQNAVCRKWTGESRANPFEEIVFVTKNGMVYHKNRDCTYLKPSIESIPESAAAGLRNADGGKYYSCRACRKGKNTNTKVVYITKYGNRYHGRKNCSRIRRTVFAVHLSKTEARRACSKCGKE